QTRKRRLARKRRKHRRERGAHAPVRAGIESRQHGDESFGIESSDGPQRDRKSTRLNSSHRTISYAVFCLKKQKRHPQAMRRPQTAPLLSYPPSSVPTPPRPHPTPTPFPYRRSSDLQTRKRRLARKRRKHRRERGAHAPVRVGIESRQHGDESFGIESSDGPQ